MALGISNINTTLIELTLDSSSHNIGVLCKDNLINIWSRFKPVQGDWPQDSSSHFGFNLPTNWTYRKPSSKYRLGDFRGYEHNKTLTDPPVYSDNTNTSGTDFMPTTKTANVIPWQGTWLFGKNTASDDIRILPADLNLSNYYWGVKLVSPDIGVYYKTLNNLNDNATIGFDLTFTNPGAAGYTDFPQNWDTGQWNWSLFISSTSSLNWTTSAPSNIIYLPTDTEIPRLISGGHFHILPYVVYGIGSYTPITALPSAGGNFAYTAGSLSSGYDYGVVNTNSGSYITVNVDENSWIHYRFYDSTNSYGLAPTDSTNSSCIDGCVLRIWCDANSGDARSPEIYLGSYGVGSSYSFTINQAGHPPSFNHNPMAGMSWTSGPTASANNADTQIYITGTPTGFYSGSGARTMYVWVTLNGVWVGNVLSFGAHDGTNYNQWISGLPPMGAGTYNIYYDSVDRHNQ